MWHVHEYFHKWQDQRYRDGLPYANWYAMNEHLVELKATTHPHWQALPSQAMQAELKRIDDAYQRFFKGLGGKPKIKKRHKFKKVKGSGRWWRCVRQLSRLYRHVANQRKDWHWKLATDLCKRFDTIVLETLNIDGMKRLWGRKVSDLAFYQFVQILAYKCQKHKRHFFQIGQWTATTKPCSNCGHRNENLTLSDRQWTCPECGTHHDRDVNAAINILRAGIAA